MSAADAARDAIQRVAKDAYSRAFEAGAAFARTHTPVQRTTDLVEAMQALIGFIVAAEHLADMAAEAQKQAREVLATTMADVGAPQIQSSTFLAYLSKKPAFVSIDQPDLVPAEFWKTPEPAIDKRAVKQAIDAGEQVPGATLLTPNSQTLNIRNRQRDAA